MNYSNISFPHPVLGISDDIRSQVEIKPNIESTSESYIIIVHLNHDNSDLDQLVSEEEAEYLCEVTCSNTVYRNSFKSSIPRIEFEIPRKSLKNKVKFECFLVAKDKIGSYSNRNAHPDYGNFVFDIDRGELLAFFGAFSFDADIKYEKLKAVSSFMDVVEKTDLEYTEIDLKKNKIEVQLPTHEFKIFSADPIGKEPRLASIFHASIVLNALLIALYNFEEYKDKFQWAKVIAYRLRNDAHLKTLSIAEKENVPEIAQRLLGNPFCRLMIELDKLIDSPLNN